MVECTCDEGDPQMCQKVWYCCDCKREMMHKHGDLFARCENCWAELEAKL